MSYKKILAGPAVALSLYFFLGNFTDAGEIASRMAGIAALMAVWWLTEAVPMAVTALVPVVFFPLLGILDSKQTSMQYMDPIIFLFIGGFIIAYGIEKWMLHERIALKILMKVGSRPANILMGVMITTFLISMWISNTATVMMLYASVMAIISRIENNSNGNPQLHGITVSLLLGLAYAASIGGMATLVGTPTNMIFYRAYNEQYPHDGGVNFLSWFLTALPISLILLVFTFLLLRFLYIRSNASIGLNKSFFRDSYKSLGKTSYEEKTVGVIFFMTALLWFTRADIEIAGIKFRGWSSLFGAPDYISDGVVAVAMAALLFFIPSKQNRGESLLVWRDMSRLPFDIILLFGGGFALAKGMEASEAQFMAGIKSRICLRHEHRSIHIADVRSCHPYQRVCLQRSLYSADASYIGVASEGNGDQSAVADDTRNTCRIAWLYAAGSHSSEHNSLRKQDAACE